MNSFMKEGRGIKTGNCHFEEYLPTLIFRETYLVFLFILFLDSSLLTNVPSSQCRSGAHLSEFGRYARSCPSHWTLYTDFNVRQPGDSLLIFFQKWRNQPCSDLHWPASAALSRCWRYEVVIPRIDIKALKQKSNIKINRVFIAKLFSLQ